MESAVSIQVIILAAGKGSRLGRALPKPLTELNDGRSIMQQQRDNIHAAFGSATRIAAVVGFKAEYIVDRFPEFSFIYNEQYDQTNTSKSLLRGLKATKAGGVLWMNGDVVFDPAVLLRAAALVAADRSFVTVNTASVSDEEVKYTVDQHGFINELSKTVRHGALGEAVGINYISAQDKHLFMQHLAQVDNDDYFEAALEQAIAQHRLQLTPMDISDLYAVEVDFAADLERANLFV